MYCYSCDTRNPDYARFCVSCGRPLAVAAAPAPAAPAAQVMPPPAASAYTAPALSYAVPARPAYAGPAPAAVPGRVTFSISEPTLNLLIRALWFLLVGLWLGQLWVVIAWLFNLTLIGMPVGVWMLNRLPQVMTLRPQVQRVSITPGHVYAATRPGSAGAWIVRTLYFVLIGWWASLLWLIIGWLFAASIIGLPIAFLMFERVGTVTTLADS